MTEDLERQLIERIEALEARLEHLESREPSNSPEVIAEALTVLVKALDTYHIQRILRELERAHWGSVFACQPLEVLLKLRASVSKNTWKELVEDWQSDSLSYGLSVSQDQFIRLAIQLQAMGEISCRVDLPGYQKLGFYEYVFQPGGTTIDDLQAGRMDLSERTKVWREQVLAPANHPEFVRPPNDLIHFEGEGQ